MRFHRSPDSQNASEVDSDWFMRHNACLNQMSICRLSCAIAFNIGYARCYGPSSEGMNIYSEYMFIPSAIIAAQALWPTGLFTSCIKLY